MYINGLSAIKDDPYELNEISLWKNKVLHYICWYEGVRMIIITDNSLVVAKFKDPEDEIV